MRVTTYVYPDGTKSIRKPRDGEVFRIWDNVDNNEAVWQWDGYKEQWCRLTYNLDGPIEPIEVLGVFGREPKCECGSEKTGSNRHSTWCKKWDSNQ